MSVIQIAPLVKSHTSRLASGSTFTLHLLEELEKIVIQFELVKQVECI